MGSSKIIGQVILGMGIALLLESKSKVPRSFQINCLYAMGCFRRVGNDAVDDHV